MCFGAILGEFLIEIFEKFQRPQHFEFQISLKSAVPPLLQHCYDPQGSPSTAPSVGMLWRVRSGAILGDFPIEIFENFRGGKILRSKSRDIAPKSAVPDVLQPGNDPQGFPNTVPSVGMLRRVRSGAILGEFRTEIFEKFSRPQNFAIEIARHRAEIAVPNCAPLATAVNHTSPVCYLPTTPRGACVSVPFSAKF